MFRFHFVALAKTVAPAMSDGELVALSVDPSDGGLRVHTMNGGAGGGGTEYTEGAVDSTISGPAIMWEDTGDTLRSVSAAKPLPVNVVAGGGGGSNAAASATGAAVPAQAGYTGVNVGGNLQGAVGFDLDSGGGTQFVLGISLRKAASGGSVELGTLADPIRTDPTGTTAQPVTDNGGSLTVDGTVTVQDGGGAVSVDDNGGALTVDNGGTFATQETGAALTALQLLDDAVATTASAIPTKGLAVSGTDGTNARVLKTDASGELQVDVLTLPALPAGTNNIGDVDVLTLPALPAGTNNIGDVDVLTVPANMTVDLNRAAGTTLLTGAGNTGAGSPRVTIASDQAQLTVTDAPQTSGGLSKYHAVSAATTNTANVKASAGQVYAITAFNLNASPRYLKFHNTSGTPTAGSGVTDTFLIPGNTAGAGLVINIDKGIAFSTGIGVSIVAGIGDSDTTAISASEVVVNIYYK